MELYTIGKVAEMCNVSVKTLRYYDEINLLKPAKVSKENQYRYYTDSEIQKIPLIKYFKEIGFKLEDISQLLKHYEINTLTSYFDHTLQQLGTEIAELERKRFAIKEWRTLIADGQQYKSIAPTVTFELAIFPKMETVSIQIDGFDPVTAEIEHYFSNAFVAFCQEQSHFTYGPFILYFEQAEERLAQTFQRVTCYSMVMEEEGKSASRTIGGHPAAIAKFIGSYDQIPAIYQGLKEWAAEHQVPIRGDSYERYLVDSWSTSNEEEYITEIIMPLKWGEIL